MRCGGAEDAPLVLVRGSGDIGSAVAHALFCAGYAVAIHDSPQPAAPRRRMAFADALFDGRARLAGIEARRLDELPALQRCLQGRHAIPVTTLELSRLLAFLQPAVLVNARMRKREIPEEQRGLAPLVVGLGPNCSAGENVDLAVETAWGDTLGGVVESGTTLPLRGEPRPIGGCARERYVYAPRVGTFITGLAVGAPVMRGQPVATIGGETLHSPLSGRSGVMVATGTKVIEVNPRGPDAQISGIAERPGQIAKGVLLALQGRGVLPSASGGVGVHDFVKNPPVSLQGARLPWPALAQYHSALPASGRCRRDRRRLSVQCQRDAVAPFGYLTLGSGVGLSLLYL